MDENFTNEFYVVDFTQIVTLNSKFYKFDR